MALWKELVFTTNKNLITSILSIWRTYHCKQMSQWCLLTNWTDGKPDIPCIHTYQDHEVFCSKGALNAILHKVSQNLFKQESNKMLLRADICVWWQSVKIVVSGFCCYNKEESQYQNEWNFWTPKNTETWQHTVVFFCCGTSASSGEETMPCSDIFNSCINLERCLV